MCSLSFLPGGFSDSDLVDVSNDDTYKPDKGKGKGKGRSGDPWLIFNMSLQQRSDVNTLFVPPQQEGVVTMIRSTSMTTAGVSFHYLSKCVCEHSGSGSVFVLPDTTAEVGTIAGIASAVAMALVGAISSYISYQKKKLCFSIQRKATPHTGFRGAAPQSVQSSFIYTAPKHSSRTRLRV